MSALARLKQPLLHLCIAVTFFTSGLVINFMQLVLHLFLKPINERLFRKMMNYLCYSLYSQLVFYGDWYSNSKIHLFIDDIENRYPGKETALIIMNHSYEIDWLFGFMQAEKRGMLGNCKSFIKKVAAYVPVIGWAWYLAEYIFLERSFEKDKKNIERQLKKIISYPDPVCVLLSAEGTRFTEEKHKASVNFAKTHGLPILKHHLTPRTKGFVAILANLRDGCPAIYDYNLAFRRDAKNPPTASSILNGKSIEAFLYVRRIPVDTIPVEEEKAAAWLRNLYVEKDKIIDSFHNTGSFFKTSGFKEAPEISYEKSYASLINFVAWACLSFSSVMYYFITSLIHQNWIGLSITVGLLIMFYMFMRKAVNMSSMSQTSNYGVDSSNVGQHK